MDDVSKEMFKRTDGNGNIDFTEDEVIRVIAQKINDVDKEAARAVWVEAWLQAKDVEEPGERARQVAIRRFNQWWEVNIE